jgi:hypothetical protein
MELQAVVPGGGEHAVEDEGVEVDVRVEGPAEALNNRQAAAPAVAEAEPARPPALEAEERADVDGEDGATEAVVPGQQVAQPVREAEHPLPDGHTWEDRVHGVGGALGHPAAPATGAEAAALARKGQEVVQPAALALEAGETLGQEATREELPELVLHEAGQAGAVRPIGHFAQECLQVGAHDGVEHPLLRRAGAVTSGGEPHGP